MRKRIHKERADDLVRLHVAEPAPLGLFGLSIGCLVLLFVDFGVTHGQLMMIPWLFLLPAGLQLIAGCVDFLRHNIFGGTAFIGYSVFWFGLSCVYYLEIAYMNHSNIDEILPPKPIIRQHTAIVCIGYLLFSIILTVISLGVNRILLSILSSIDFAFFVLILHSFWHDKIPALVVAVALCFVFLTSMYGFLAILLLKVAGGEVLPIGAPYLKWIDYVIIDKQQSSKIQKTRSRDREFEKVSNANSGSDSDSESSIARMNKLQKNGTYETHTYCSNCTSIQMES